MPTANLMPDNQSLAIGGVKLNYTIRAFLSGIVLFGGSIDSECKQVWFSIGSIGTIDTGCFILNLQK